MAIADIKNHIGRRLALAATFPVVVIVFVGAGLIEFSAGVVESAVDVCGEVAFHARRLAAEYRDAWQKART